MSLPNLPYDDTLRREVRTEWGGLNLNENAGDGELIEALNLSSRAYPLLATRKPWYMKPINQTGAPTIKNAAAFGASRYWFWVSEDPENAGTYKFYYNGTPKGTLSGDREIASRTRFACLRDKIYVFPAEKVYDEVAGTWEGMNLARANLTARFMDGEYAGVPAKANTIYVATGTWQFNVGDAVTISGCTTVPENNKTAVIREISGKYLRFYENTFSLRPLWRYDVSGSLAAGTYHFTIDGTTYQFDLSPGLSDGDWLYWIDNALRKRVGETPTTIVTTEGDSGTELSFYYAPITYDETGVTVQRAVPFMSYVCVNENRLWGCYGDKIYASKLGDPLNFNVFDGLATDSWTAETGTPGDFTGCISYQGYPIFFKENCAFRVMGDIPSNFSLRKLEIPGVLRYSDRSLAAVGPALFYLSNKGICSWDGGGYPSIISLPLGIDREWQKARAGTDGVRYYISLWELTNVSGAGEFTFVSRDYCYDCRFGTWHRLNISREVSSTGTSPQPNQGLVYSCYAQAGDNLYFLDSDKNNFLALEGRPMQTPWTQESDNSESYNWTITFADSTRAYKTALTGSEGKKGTLRLLIRCKLAGTMKVWIAYDGGDFEEIREIGGINGAEKDSYVVPLILRRCDFWQLRLTGTGGAVIYSIAVEKYGGEWQQAK